MNATPNQKKPARKPSPIPLIIVTALVISAFEYGIASWIAHADGGLLPQIAAIIGIIYGAIGLRRGIVAKKRSATIAAACLLGISILIELLSQFIPFCPECDHNPVTSPILRFFLWNKKMW